MTDTDSHGYTRDTGSIDLGSAHSMDWVARRITCGVAHVVVLPGPPEPDEIPIGGHLYHPRPDGEGRCSSAWMMDQGWKLISTDPVTVTPSLLCRRCGDHGFIRDGRWVAA